MAVRVRLPVMLLVLSVAVLSSAGRGSSASFMLEKSHPKSPHLHERSRHARILGSSSSPGNINYELDGGSRAGFYYTKIYLGSPPQELKVLVDTGSDVLWISCTSTAVQNSSRVFHPESSETSSAVNCSEPICLAGRRSSDSYCSDEDACIFSLSYGDGSLTTGHYISDLLHYERTSADSVTTTSAVPIVFGCSTKEDIPTDLFGYADGIMGLGHNSLSLVSQLSTQGTAPRAISHCLRRDGAGVLMFGAAVAPNMVYTPIVPSKYFYTVNLQSVHVDGLPLPVDPSVFNTSGDRGTFVDSGTTMAYLVGEAYDPFLHAVTRALSRPVDQFILNGAQCYSISSVGIDIDIFPQIRLVFEGGASLALEPKDYIHKKTSADGAAVDAWCLRLLRAHVPGMSVLGEAVLMDKLVVYDVEAGRLGWADFNCSIYLNESTFDMGNTDIPRTTGDLQGDSLYALMGDSAGSMHPRCVGRCLLVAGGSTPFSLCQAIQMA